MIRRAVVQGHRLDELGAVFPGLQVHLLVDGGAVDLLHLLDSNQPIAALLETQAPISSIITTLLLSDTAEQAAAESNSVPM
jgi:hypothetical protein